MPAHSLRYGKTVDISWAPFSDPIGCGTVLAIASEQGSLAFVDTMQTLELPSHQQRQATFRGLAAGVLSRQQVGLRLHIRARSTLQASSDNTISEDARHSQHSSFWVTHKRKTSLVQAPLPPATPLGSSLLMPTSWTLLLRLLLQLGVSPEGFQAFSKDGRQSKEIPKTNASDVEKIFPVAVQQRWREEALLPAAQELKVCFTFVSRDFHEKKMPDSET